MSALAVSWLPQGLGLLGKRTSALGVQEEGVAVGIEMRRRYREGEVGGVAGLVEAVKVGRGCCAGVERGRGFARDMGDRWVGLVVWRMVIVEAVFQRRGVGKLGVDSVVGFDGFRCCIVGRLEAGVREVGEHRDEVGREGVLCIEVVLQQGWGRGTSQQKLPFRPLLEEMDEKRAAVADERLEDEEQGFDVVELARRVYEGAEEGRISEASEAGMPFEPMGILELALVHDQLRQVSLHIL